jgi:hypothetical protein
MSVVWVLDPVERWSLVYMTARVHSPESHPFCWDTFPERIYDITYHISPSPYYSEDIHTNYPRVLHLEIRKNKLEQIMPNPIKADRIMFSLQINSNEHRHEHKS